MLDLDAEKIKTYQTCSLLYKYRYLDFMHEPIMTEVLIRTRFQNILKRVMTFYFYQKQEGNQPSMKSLTSRFQKLWFGDGYTAEDLFTETTHSGNKRDKIQLAANTIQYFINFYEDFDQRKDIPLLIREDFSVPLGREIKLSGVFDLVLKDQENYSVIKWRADSGNSLKTADYFIDFAILDHAFKYRMQNKKYNQVKYYIYDFTSTNPGMHEMNINADNKYAIEYWTDLVLKDKIHAPRRGLTTHCKTCWFDSPCSKYSITEEMIKKPERA